MNILVVGGAGYIGSHFVLEASRAGHNVVVFDDLSSGFKNNIDNELTHVEQELAKRKYIAVGEIGLDLYWDKTKLEIQKKFY